MRFARHWNSNQLAAISIRTNGDNPTVHEIVDICLLLLDAELKINKEFKPFWSTMQPRRPKVYDPESMKISRVEYSKILVNSLDADMMADLFEEWFEKLRLANHKKIMLLAFDWSAIRPFMTRWLGVEHMKYFFDADVRDIKVASIYENDKADHQAVRYPFPCALFSRICRAMGTPLNTPSTTLQDCMMMAEAYRRMLKTGARVIGVADDDNLATGEEPMQDMQLDERLTPRS